jgi:leucyl aminopeptidase
VTDFTPMLAADHGQPATPIEVVSPAGYDAWLARQSPSARAALAGQRFTGKTGVATFADESGTGFRAVAIVAEPASPWALAKAAEVLPAGPYRLVGEALAGPALGWLLGQYRFERYRRSEDAGARVLLTDDPAIVEETLRIAAATAKVRDLVNTGAGDLGPAELEAEARALADRHGARLTVTAGEALANDYPMIHAVGCAAAAHRQPRLIELEWGSPDHPRVAIVGKGVCFDTGGLDIKPSSGMRLMKKDMGGAAHALALAGLVMAAGLKLNLHLLIPAVENAISADAFRPGDVLRTRAGLPVENTNTDAEGRLILADALAKAAESEPALILDYATLTGAARVALGPDLPPLFTDDDGLAADLLAAGEAVEDPLWRLPLWDGYDDMLKSDVADLVNAPDGGFAGAITAGLFLRRFVPKGMAWAHLDVFAWRPTARPGRPKGGDAYALRAAYEVLKARYPG